ncbi:family 2 glycosyl transferase [Paenibacillus ferrarius]|uniref:Family 2 glycosyl transferase n=1 Tax=Paenibacillus ferrarius TaxID=1469647 RepID=A0A1V4HG06_9BACL|nr:glycosyltransferase family 2 protein [Paenibacillus ferrarius]OPH54563.1 family 2 glycosyl transferase [Paenibacillus ferrarius]
MKISVCMIVKDEEKQLPRSLASIPIEYETIVLDTGSKDRSVEVAKQFGTRIFSYTWNNHFAEARNYCASYATGEYILFIDADEELPQDCFVRLQQFVQQFPNSTGSVTINNVLQDGIKHHRMIRFYPNRPEYKFHGVVHEQVYCGTQPALFEDTGLQISHYGYSEEIYKEKDKANRYLPMYLSHLEQYPNDGYMRYQLGKLYYSTGKYIEAEQQLRLGLNINEVSALYFPVMVVMLGYTLKEQGKFKEAVMLLKQYAPVYPQFPDMPFLLGLLAMDTGEIGVIETHFKMAIEIGETAKYSSVAGVGSYKAAYNLGVYYEVIGELNKGLDYYRYSSDLGYEEAASRLLILRNTSS